MTQPCQPHSEVVQAYSGNGFAICHSVLSQSELISLQSEIERLLQFPAMDFESCYLYTDRDGGGEPDTYLADPLDSTIAQGALESDSSLSRIDSMLPFSPPFLRLLGHPFLLSLMEAVLGPDFVVVSESLVFKTARTGIGFGFHQDGDWLLGENTRVPRGLNVGVYLHDSTEESGCLRVVPANGPQGKLDVTDSQLIGRAQNVPAKAGDVLIHSRDSVHGSLPNRSAFMRVTCYFTGLPRALAEAAFGEEAVARRTEIIPLAVQSRFCADGQTPYVYQPLKSSFSCPVSALEVEAHPSLRLPAMNAV